METTIHIKNKWSLICVLFSFLSQLCFGQESVPEPTYVFNFNKSDYTSLEEEDKGRLLVVDNEGNVVSGYHVKTHGITSSSFISDRHGNLNSAIKFDAPSERLEYSMSSDADAETFFGLAKKTENHPDAFTISFWMKYLAYEGPTSFTLFAAKSTKLEVSKPKFGLAHSNEGLFMFKYIENEQGQIGDQWKYPLYTPAEFDAGQGWYFIMIVYDYVQKYTRIMIGKPNGGATYGPGTNEEVPGDATVQREFDGRLIWIPGFKPSLNNFQYWYTGGGVGGSGLRNMRLDDMKIYNESISLEDAQSIYLNEKTSNMNYQIAQSVDEEIIASIGTPEKVPEGSAVLDEEYLNLVPNPTLGLTNIIFNSKNKGLAAISIYDLSGRVLHTTLIEAAKGNNEILVDVIELGLVNGQLYIVEIQTPSGGYLNKKLTVKGE